MTDEEKKEFSSGVELSFDISDETMQKLKEALGINELEQIHKRFEDGTETIEDIMYHCLNYGMDLKNGKQLRLVETKYFDKLVKHIEKQNKIINEMAEYLAIVRDCPNEDFGRNLDCENRCNNTDELYAECWRMYFEEKIKEDK